MRTQKLVFAIGLLLGLGAAADDTEDVDVITIVMDPSVPANARAIIDLKVKKGDKVFKIAKSLVGPNASAAYEVPGKSIKALDVDKIKFGKDDPDLKLEGTYKKKDSKKVYEIRIYKEAGDGGSPLGGDLCAAGNDTDAPFISCQDATTTCVDHITTCD